MLAAQYRVAGDALAATAVLNTITTVADCPAAYCHGGTSVAIASPDVQSLQKRYARTGREREAGGSGRPNEVSQVRMNGDKLVPSVVPPTYVRWLTREQTADSERRPSQCQESVFVDSLSDSSLANMQGLLRRTPVWRAVQHCLEQQDFVVPGKPAATSRTEEGPALCSEETSRGSYWSGCLPAVVEPQLGAPRSRLTLGTVCRELRGFRAGLLHFGENQPGPGGEGCRRFSMSPVR